MKIDLTHRHAVITGSTSGIGFAIAHGLAEAGAAVVINGAEKLFKWKLVPIYGSSLHANEQATETHARRRAIRGAKRRRLPHAKSNRDDWRDAQ